MRNTKSPKVPKYRKQAAKPHDRAFVMLDGERHYLGRHGTPESRAAYRRLVAEWLAGGGRLPIAPDDLTVVELCARFRAWADGYYKRPDGTPSSHATNFRAAIKPLVDLYAETSVKDFGPVQLKAVRQRFIDGKLSRVGVNRSVGMIRRVFKWGVAEGLVNVNVHAALLAVDGLRRGRTEAVENEPVRPVPDAHIEAVRLHVSRQVAAMIDVQLLTAARAGEIVVMRAVDIDMQGTVWTHSPKEHKTAWHGHSRTIYLGPRAQDVVRPFLAGRAVDAFLFSPREAEDARYAKRKTHRHQAVAPAKTDREVGDAYDVDSYRRAIHRACDKAEVPRWSPHRLRHNAATTLRREHGIDIAQTILGHRLGSGITEVYAEMNIGKALDIMARVG